MGIILLMVALIPLLGVEGFQPIKAEASGLEKREEHSEDHRHCQDTLAGLLLAIYNEVCVVLQ